MSDINHTVDEIGFQMPNAVGETRTPAPDSRQKAETDLTTRATCRLGQVAGSTSRQVAAPITRKAGGNSWERQEKVEGSKEGLFQRFQCFQNPTPITIVFLSYVIILLPIFFGNTSLRRLLIDESLHTLDTTATERVC